LLMAWYLYFFTLHTKTKFPILLCTLHFFKMNKIQNYLYIYVQVAIYNNLVPWYMGQNWKELSSTGTDVTDIYTRRIQSMWHYYLVDY